MFGGRIQFWPTHNWVPVSNPLPLNFHEKISMSSCDGRLIWHLAMIQEQGSAYRLYDSLNVALLTNIRVWGNNRIFCVNASDTSWLIAEAGPNANLSLTRTPRLLKLSLGSGVNFQQVAHLNTFNMEGFNVTKRDSLYAYWMVYYDQTNSRMVSMPFDEFGFYPANNVYSDTITRPFLFTHANRIEFSSSGEILAMADYNSNILHLWRFNKTTGVLSQHLEMNLASLLGLSLWHQRLLTLCFSQNGTKIYVKASGVSTNGANGFYQLDIRSWDTTQILNSIQYLGQAGRIYTWPTIAPDGNIYFNSFSDLYGDTLSYGRLTHTDSVFQSSYLTNRLYDFSLRSLAGANIGLHNRLPTSPSFLLNPNRYSIVTQNHCLGDSTRLSLYDYQNLDTVVWDFGDGSPGTSAFAPAHLYAAAGNYTVTAYTRYCNRPDTLSFQLQIIGEPRLAFNDTSFCAGGTLSLQLDSTLRYRWSTGDSGHIIQFTAPGTYTVSLQNSCFSATDTLRIRLDSLPPASPLQDTTLCPGDRLLADPSPWFWPDGDSLPRYLDSASVYTLQFSNSCGNFNHNIRVAYWQQPPFSLPDTTICEGLVLRIDLPEYPGAAYQWYDGSTATVRSFTDSGAFALSLDHRCGARSDTLRLNTTDCNCTLYLPNAFSPNNDGINDEFLIISRCDLKNYELLIYDRWGQNIFRSTNPIQGWDGRFNGEMMPVGAYAFVIRYTPEGGNFRLAQGTVRLLR